MPILPENTKSIVLPKLVSVRQYFPDDFLVDLFAATKLVLQKNNIANAVPRGASVALLVGSRGIPGLKDIVKATVDHLLLIGAKPFIIPCMGSHGFGESSMQRSIIEGYGVTEEYIGAEIRSSMDTVIIGHTTDGVAVHVDKFAFEADCIIPIVRVKAHTNFSGPIESGLCKMLSIGIGKHNGCSRLHQEGFDSFRTLIPAVASVVLGTKHVPFGVCVIENAHDHVHTISTVRGCDILEEEPKLLEKSKSLMAKLFFDHIDVLIIEQIGKDISGAGFDPNIVGRTTNGKLSGFIGPTITRIIISDLSKDSHNNATGVGCADFITRKLYEKIDFLSTYANCIAAGSPEDARIPIIFDTEDEALLAAIQTCPKINFNQARVVKIKDTLHLTDIQVSQSLLPYCRSNNQFIIPKSDRRK